MNIQHKGVTNRDAKVRLNIRVKPQDLLGAICKDRHHCAIAQALKRQTKADFVDVGTNTVLIKKGARATRYVLDSTAKEQVRYFDTHETFAPCKVVLMPPPKSIALGTRKNEKNRSGPSGKSVKHRKPTR